MSKKEEAGIGFGLCKKCGRIIEEISIVTNKAEPCGHKQTEIRIWSKDTLDKVKEKMVK